jgi:NAD(P) transhydrogenase subunit beta
MNMSESLATVSYLGATILFILCLGGLSNQETSRRGNLYGIIGMTIAVLATVFGPHVAVPVTRGSLPRWWSAPSIGIYAAARCR